MSVSEIGATGYPMAGYKTRNAQRNTAGSTFAGQMGDVKSTQGTGITLYISNPDDGETIGSMGDHDSSITVYKTKDFDPANPVYKVKVWDEAGNVTERMVDISKVDPKNCDEIEMFAYSSHLSDSGKCTNAQRAFMGAKSIHDSANSGGSLFDKENWMDIVKEIMQMQYHAGNLKGYLDYKQFGDFMEHSVGTSGEKETETKSNVVVKPDGSRVLVVTMNIGGMETTMSLEISKPTNMQNDNSKQDNENRGIPDTQADMASVLSTSSGSHFK